VARHLIDQVIRLHGTPAHIVSDRDPKFTGRLWREFMKRCNISLGFTTARHPEADGLSERTNRTIKNLLLPYVAYRQTKWQDYLSQLEFAYNSRIHSATGLTPFYVNAGYNPDPIPTQWKTDDVPNCEDLRLKIQVAQQRAQDAINESQQRMEKYANKKRRQHKFAVGDLALLLAEDVIDPAHTTEDSRKLAPKWLGPYKITKQITPVTFELLLPETMRIHPTFHVSKLRLYIDPDVVEDRPRWELPPPETIEGHEEYEVERIEGRRRRNGRNEYLVNWKGYPDYNRSWEPESNLKNARDAIQRYLHQEMNAILEVRNVTRPYPTSSTKPPKPLVAPTLPLLCHRTLQFHSNRPHHYLHQSITVA
jgi:Chromo (CHRromatin Organisation MOdifier) domain